MEISIPKLIQRSPPAPMSTLYTTHLSPIIPSLSFAVPSLCPSLLPIHPQLILLSAMFHLLIPPISPFISLSLSLPVPSQVHPSIQVPSKFQPSISLSTPSTIPFPCTFCPSVPIPPRSFQSPILRPVSVALLPDSSSDIACSIPIPPQSSPCNSSISIPVVPPSIPPSILQSHLHPIPSIPITCHANSPTPSEGSLRSQSIFLFLCFFFGPHAM
ncbi:hypothetical protein J3F83DRAFT_652774 [Trichoderma novae-zelandiae]